jgi:hypothetical protein
MGEMFEPLLIFVVLPYRIKEPNLTKRARLLETFERRLLHQALSEVTDGGRRAILRKLFVRARRHPPLPQSMVS